MDYEVAIRYASSLESMLREASVADDPESEMDALDYALTDAERLPGMIEDRIEELYMELPEEAL